MTGTLIRNVRVIDGSGAAPYAVELLLVDGNPLADVTILRDANRSIAIMTDGRFHKPPQPRRHAQQQAAQ